MLMRSFKPILRAAVASGALGAALLLGVAPANAHVTVSPDSAAAEGYTVLTLTVPHGCGGEATNEIEVKLPETFQSVTPQAVPGWEVTRTMAELDEPYELHGSTVTEYTDTLRWSTTSSPLAADEYLTFGISAKMPAETADRVLIPVVQRCVDGSEEAWINTDPASDLPAPAIAITASAGDAHGDSQGDSAASDDQDAAAAPSAQGTASATESSDSSSNTLAIVALVAGLAGLGLGGYSLVAKKR